MQKVILNVVCVHVPAGGMAKRNRGMSVWLKVWMVIATRRHSKYKSGGALGPGDNEFKFDFGHISGNDLQTIENIALGLRRWPRLENKCQGGVSWQWKAGVPLT